MLDTEHSPAPRRLVLYALALALLHFGAAYERDLYTLVGQRPAPTAVRERHLQSLTDEALFLLREIGAEDRILAARKHAKSR